MAALYSTTAQEGIDINSVFTLSSGTPEYPAPPFVVGELAWGLDGSEFIYCKSTVTIAPGSVLVISPVPGDGTAALIGGGTIAATAAPVGQLIAVSGGGTGSVAVPAIAAPATANYFWAQRAGIAPNVRTAAAITKNAPLFSSATTAGIIGSATTGGGVGTTYAINGLVITTANGSVAGPNTAVLNYPVVGASS